jgi:hypothetical protein
MIGKWSKYKHELPAYAWPGGYPIWYYDNQSNPTCAECASTAIATFLEWRKDYAMDGYLWDYYDDLPQYMDVRYEGPDEYCAECNAVLETAYGDPFAKGNNDV